MDPVANVTNQVKSISSTSHGMIALTVIASGIAIVLVAYILYFLITKYVQKRTGATIPETVIPVITSVLQQFPGKDLPSLDNGRRFTISFWMYIYDIERFKGIMRNVFYIGSENTNITSMNSKNVPPVPPVAVVLDDSSNQLHVIFGTNNMNGDLDGIQDFELIKVQDPVTLEYINDPLQKGLEYIIAKRGITVDYIPIQRWVHVAVVVNETVNGGYIQTYIDGELVGVKNSSMKTNVTVNDKPVTFDVQSMTTTIAGDVFVGGSAATAGATVGYSGLVSKISLYNYDLNAKDIYTLYLSGPVSSLMSKVGLNTYGLQSPITRVG